MKVAVAVLCVLGIAAAACAAFLINGLTASQTRAATVKGNEDPNVTVLYVTRAASAMSVVDGSLIESKAVPRAQAPAGYLSNAADILGKLVCKSLVAGQPFTKDCFGEITGGKQLAGVIPKGMRAVGISVTDFSALDGIIYPGSMVDVMVSFRGEDSSDNHRDAVTTTLVQNVQVLAFEQQTVASSGKALTDLDPTRSGNTRRVTLLVDTKQSKSLNLAMQQGTLSLALRNPLDDGDGDRDAVTVRGLMNDGPRTEAAKPSPVPMAAAVIAPAAVPSWDVVVIRGGQAGTQTFPPTASEGSATKTK